MRIPNSSWISRFFNPCSHSLQLIIRISDILLYWLRKLSDCSVEFLRWELYIMFLTVTQRCWIFFSVFTILLILAMLTIENRCHNTWRITTAQAKFTWYLMLSLFWPVTKSLVLCFVIFEASLLFKVIQISWVNNCLNRIFLDISIIKLLMFSWLAYWHFGYT